MVMLFILIQGPLKANDRLFLYGTEISSEGAYYYLGMIIPVNFNNEDYFLRLWSDMPTYEYDNNTSIIKAQSKNLQVSVGTQFTQDFGLNNLYLGYAINNTEFTPDDLNNESRGRHGQLAISVDGAYKVFSCDDDLNYGVSYLFDKGAYWLRLRSVCWRYKEKKLGVELVSHGDSDYRHTQLGAILSNEKISTHTYYSLKAGLTMPQDLDVFPYIGIELTTLY